MDLECRFRIVRPEGDLERRPPAEQANFRFSRPISRMGVNNAAQVDFPDDWIQLWRWKESFCKDR